MRFAGANSSTAALAAAVGLTGALAAATPSLAQDCPGNPDAIGTSRVLVIDPAEFPHVGTMQYPQTLPLEDHEVVLTFDDGPLPPNSNKILDILAAQCVRATYFLVGEMAHAYPETVRRIHEDGHTIGTHSQTHPINIRRLPDERVREEIEQGIASVSTALGDPTAVAPFFRIPGLERSDILDQELDAHSLVTFSADIVADDWHRHITPAEIIARGMRRLEAKGRGILLLHDIHPWTVAALPGLLKELKEHGYRIVQVVPAGPGMPATAIAGLTELRVAWTLAQQESMDEGSGAPIWPKLDDGLQPERVALPAPDAEAFEVSYPLAPATSKAEVASADESTAALPSGVTAWPDEQAAAAPISDAELPAPSVQDIGWPVQQQRRAVEPRLALRPSLAATGSVEHSRHRHAHFDAHNKPHRHARAPAAAGQHAGLTATLAALFTPAK